ncbi:MAG: HAMP domain-containing sensor histidine kinase [bacterium]
MKRDYEIAKLKLAGVIFAIIFVLIQIYSIIFVYTRYNTINRFQDIPGFPRLMMFEDRIREERESTLALAFTTQIGLSILGAIASYVFADYALRPVKEGVEKQRRFLAFASHELKTPVATLSLLAESEDKKISKDFKEEIDKLSLSVEKYLDLLRNNHQKANITDVKLDEVIAEVLKKSETIYKFKELGIEYTKSDVTIKTDKHILGSILRNIIENAVKYSPEKSEVSIVVYKDEINATIEVINKFVETQSGYGIGHEIIKTYSKIISADFEFNKDSTKAYAKLILPLNIS